LGQALESWQAVWSPYRIVDDLGVQRSGNGRPVRLRAAVATSRQSADPLAAARQLLGAEETEAHRQWWRRCEYLLQQRRPMADSVPKSEALQITLKRRAMTDPGGWLVPIRTT